MKFYMCPAICEDLLKRAIDASAERVFHIYEGARRLFFLQIDEIASDQRVSYDQHNDEVRNIRRLK